MNTIKIGLLELLSFLFFSFTASQAQNSKYFPENSWGVYTWGGGLDQVTPDTFPFVKGAAMILRWNEVEPEPGNFKFDQVIRKKFEYAERHGY